MANKFKPYEQAGRIIRLFGWLELILGVIVVVSIGLPMVAQNRTPDPMSFLGLLSVVLPVFNLKLGKGMKEHKTWAKTVGIAYSILLLLGFPLGTAIGAYV